MICLPFYIGTSINASPSGLLLLAMSDMLRYVGIWVECYITFVAYGCVLGLACHRGSVDSGLAGTLAEHCSPSLSLVR